MKNIISIILVMALLAGFAACKKLPDGSYEAKTTTNKYAELVGEGYDAIIVQNPNGLYRVICASYDSRSEAAEARARFKAAHPNNADYQKAWLLYNN